MYTMAGYMDPSKVVPRSLPLVLLVMVLHHVAGQDGALAPRPPQWEGASAGMNLLYQIQNGFLNDLIQSSTIGDVINDYKIEEFADFASDEFLNAWSEWILVALGYMVCVSIGLVLVIVLPCTGCGICCARTCKCCGCCCCCSDAGKPKNKDKMSKWECKRIGFSVTMSCLSAILLASVVCGFVACGQIQKQIEPYGFLDTILQGMYTIDDYVASTSVQLDKEILVPVGDNIGDLNTTITLFPQLLVIALGKNVSMLPDLANFQLFAHNLQGLVDNLTLINEGGNLQTLATTLETDLTLERAHIQTVLNGCVPLCQNELDRAVNLTMSTDYTGLTDMSTEIGIIDGLLPGVVSDIDVAAATFWDISADVSLALDPLLDDIQSGIGDFEQGVTDSVYEMQSALAEINLTSIEHSIWEIKPDFHQYGSYVYWGLMGLMCVCTLIIFCYVMGVILGMVLPSPSRHSSCCSPTSKHGSSFLLAGVGLTLVFSWLLMLLAMLSFALGGLVENNFCRHLVVYDESMDELENLFLQEMDSNYTFSIKNTTLSCERNDSLYLAANMEANGVNISDVVDLNQYGIYDMLDSLRNTSIPIAVPPDVITPAINASMLTISGAIDTLPLNAYDTELAKPITIESIPTYIADLETLITKLSNPVVISDIQTEINHLNAIYNGSYKDVVDERASVQVSLDDVHSIIGLIDLPDILGRLTQAELTLASDTDGAMKYAQDVMADDIQTLLETLSKVVENAVRYQIGGCRKLFDAGASMVDGACVYFLEPVNAVWFCLGWFLIFSILAVAFGNQLAYIYGAQGSTHKIEPIGEEFDTVEHNVGYGTGVTPALPMAPLVAGPPLPPKAASGEAMLPLSQTPDNGPAFRGVGKNKVSPYADEDAYLRSDEHYYI